MKLSFRLALWLNASLWLASLAIVGGLGCAGTMKEDLAGIRVASNQLAKYIDAEGARLSLHLRAESYKRMDACPTGDRDCRVAAVNAVFDESNDRIRRLYEVVALQHEVATAVQEADTACAGHSMDCDALAAKVVSYRDRIADALRGDGGAP